MDARLRPLPPTIPPPTVPTPVAPVTPPSNNPSNVQPLPDVPYYGTSRQWNLNVMGAPEAWAAGYTGQGTLVAVVDTGVDLNHRI